MDSIVIVPVSGNTGAVHVLIENSIEVESVVEKFVFFGVIYGRELVIVPESSPTPMFERLREGLFALSSGPRSLLTLNSRFLTP